MKTFADAVERYTNTVQTSWATLSQVKRLSRAFGQNPLDKIGRALVSEYRDLRLSEASAATVTREMAVLHRIMSLAVNEWEWLDKNPAHGVAYPRGQAKRDRWLIQEEEDKLLKSSPVWLSRALLFALNTGMRRGELLALQWENVQPDYIVIDRSKNGDRRGIPIGKKLAEIVVGIRKRSGHVIVDENGLPVTPNKLEYAFRLTIRSAGVTNLHFHDLRHTFATRLAQKGIDLYQIQKLLGHRSPLMTQRYSHHSVESLRGAVSALDTEP